MATRGGMLTSGLLVKIDFRSLVKGQFLFYEKEPLLILLERMTSDLMGKEHFRSFGERIFSGLIQRNFRYLWSFKGRNTSVLFLKNHFRPFGKETPPDVKERTTSGHLERNHFLSIFAKGRFLFFLYNNL